jgi:hypothetical protein
MSKMIKSSFLFYFLMFSIRQLVFVLTIQIISHFILQIPRVDDPQALFEKIKDFADRHRKP